jgi:hypothetical protein
LFETPYGLFRPGGFTVALAIFPVERYTGTVTTDLFAEDETSYFDDAEQIFALQREEVAQLVKHHEASAAWIEVTEEYNIPDWRYRKAKKKEPKGVLINLSPSGEVEIIEGLAKTQIDDETAEAIAENPIVPPKAKAAYAKPLCQYIAHHKTLAVAEILLASPRAAQEVMIVATLKKFRLHDAVRTFAEEAEPQGAFRVLEAQARQFAAKLGFAVEEGESVWSSFPPPFSDELALYEAVSLTCLPQAMPPLPTAQPFRSTNENSSRYQIATIGNPSWAYRQHPGALQSSVVGQAYSDSAHDRDAEFTAVAPPNRFPKCMALMQLAEIALRRRLTRRAQ